ncbi:MAG: hypothetical protein AAB692_02390 [Patescibacteria group bacterium]
MKRQRRSILFTEFAVLGGFVLAALIGYFVALGAVLWPAAAPAVAPEETLSAAAPAAPGIDEYRAEVSSVATPFLSQASRITADDFKTNAEAVAGLSSLAQKTQERLLRVRVPGKERTTHLALVLLIEQWKRALAGSKLDRKAVVINTQHLIRDHDWLTP